MSKIVENYVLLELVGHGQYGECFKAKHFVTNELVAIKVLKIQIFKQFQKLQDMIINEIQALKRIDSIHIIKFIKMLKTSNNVYLVYEYCDGKSLEELLDAQKHLKESQALIVLRQIVSALKILNQNNIMHRDIKPQNILFHQGNVKIADFGFCKILDNSNQKEEMVVGSPIYMAPEILEGRSYGLNADIYSVGVVLYEMLFGVCPFEETSHAALIRKIKSTPLQIPREVNPISPETESILFEMLEPDPTNRISIGKLVAFAERDRSLASNSHKDSQGSSIFTHTLSPEENQNFAEIFRFFYIERAKIMLICEVVSRSVSFFKGGLAPFFLMKQALAAYKELREKLASLIQTQKRGLGNFPIQKPIDFAVLMGVIQAEEEKLEETIDSFKQEVLLEPRNKAAVYQLPSDLKAETEAKETLSVPAINEYLKKVQVSYLEEYQNEKNSLSYDEEKGKLETLVLWKYLNYPEKILEQSDGMTGPQLVPLRELSFFRELRTASPSKLIQLIA